MKTIRCWNDLEKHGIVPLTGEACGLQWRLLCDVTEHGRRILQKCFGLSEMILADAWNRGAQDDPHVGSILLVPVMLAPLGVFALLESGCTEVWLYANNTLLGIEASDTAEQIELSRKLCPDAILRTFGYRGTAGDRNVHMMSGRVQ